MKIVIISSTYKGNGVQSIIKAGEKKGHTMKVLSHLYLYLFISDIENGYDRVYDGYSSDGKPERIKAKEIDAIIPRIGNGLEYGASVLEHLNNNLGIFSTQTASGIKTATNKLLSLQKISAAKLKVPKTVMANTAAHVNWLVEKVGGLPIIIKTLKGSQGVGVMIGETPMAVNSTLQSLYKSGQRVLIQEFVKTEENGAKDIRAIVIDGKVIVAMERITKGDFRSNLSLDGQGKKVDLSEKDKDICIRAARSCGLEVAGVDIIKDTDDQTYVVEVNGNYGYKVEKITGIDISTPLIEYCERNYKKGNRANDDDGKKEAAIDEIFRVQNRIKGCLFLYEDTQDTIVADLNQTISTVDSMTDSEFTKATCKQLSYAQSCIGRRDINLSHIEQAVAHLQSAFNSLSKS